MLWLSKLRRLRKVLFPIALLLISQPSWTSNEPNIEVVMRHVGQAVMKFIRAMPDLVCLENYSSWKYLASEKPETIEPQTLFCEMAVRQGRENRQIILTRLKGASSLPWDQMNLVTYGGFSNLLTYYFSPVYQSNYEYKFMGEKVIRQRSCYVIEVRIPKDRSYTIVRANDGLRRRIGILLHLFVDRESFEVARWEYEGFDLPREIKQVKQSVDYASFLIGDHPYTLPARFETFSVINDEILHSISLFDGYRKFEVDTKLNFEEGQ